MKVLVWLVVSLVGIGVFTLSLRLGYWFRRRATDPHSWLGRLRRWATFLVFCLGLSCLAVAALSSWDWNNPSRADDTGEVRTGLFPPGTEAPDFSLPSLEGDGRTLSLRDFRGQKPVVLIFGSFS